MSSQGMSVPIVLKGIRIVEGPSLDILLEKANNILVQSRIGLERFSREVELLRECF